MLLMFQNTYSNNAMKDQLLQRIEPWVRRELHAILQDPDPTVIVHVATSLYIASLGRESNACSRQLGFEDNFLAPLRPFLHGKTDMFWHELRCLVFVAFNWSIKKLVTCTLITVPGALEPSNSGYLLVDLSLSLF